MGKMVMLTNPNDDTQQRLNEFWNSLFSWMEQGAIIKNFFVEKYVSYIRDRSGTTYKLNIDYEKEYQIYYGKSFPGLAIANHGVQKDEVIDFINIMYCRWIKEESRNTFTEEINSRFDLHKLPYKLCSGIVIEKRYKTTKTIDKTFNKEMFEQKIAYSEEMIMSCEMLDKKCALDCLVDALQYIISIQNQKDVKKNYASLAANVCADQNSKTYALVKTEIDYVMRISNEYFDIRHNEALNKAKENREVLKDSQFIEYLYNRIYDLLYLLRLKVNKANLVCNIDTK